MFIHWTATSLYGTTKLGGKMTPKEKIKIYGTEKERGKGDKGGEKGVDIRLRIKTFLAQTWMDAAREFSMAILRGNCPVPIFPHILSIGSQSFKGLPLFLLSAVLVVRQGGYDSMSRPLHERALLSSALAACLYLNRAVHRPMTSPWQTSSALNSLPSRARRISK